MFSYSFTDEALNEEDLILQLNAFGIDPFEVELVLARFLERKSMRVIMEEQGWLNLNSANYYLRRTLAKLRHGGFKIE